MNATTKEKMIVTLKTKAYVWNRWRKLSPSNPNLSGADLRYANLGYTDLRYANLSHTNLRGADLRGANLRGADLRYTILSGADLDFSCLDLSCKSLSALFDERHLIQLLYHVAIPTQNNSLNIKDKDLKKLLNMKSFQKVVNKFHRVEECGTFTGNKKEGFVVMTANSIE